MREKLSKCVIVTTVLLMLSSPATVSSKRKGKRGKRCVEDVKTKLCVATSSQESQEKIACETNVTSGHRKNEEGQMRTRQLVCRMTRRRLCL